MAERDDGVYWVKRKADPDWVLGEWSTEFSEEREGGRWTFFGTDIEWRDHELAVIGARLQEEMAKDAAAPTVDGVAIRLADGKDWIVPPLRIDQLLRHMPMLKEFSGMSPTTSWAMIGEENIGALTAMITEAMLRNYPDMTTKRLQSLLDLRTLGSVINAVLHYAPRAGVPQTKGKTDG
jgi:hypothetical protein